MWLELETGAYSLVINANAPLAPGRRVVELEMFLGEQSADWGQLTEVGRQVLTVVRELLPVDTIFAQNGRAYCVSLQHILSSDELTVLLARLAEIPPGLEVAAKVPDLIGVDAELPSEFLDGLNAQFAAIKTQYVRGLIVDEGEVPDHPVLWLAGDLVDSGAFTAAKISDEQWRRGMTAISAVSRPPGQLRICYPYPLH